MILYRNNTADFIDEVERNIIGEQIASAYLKGMGRRASDGERRAWNNSMRFMETIVRKSNIPDDCGILIEYNIPSTSKRVDFVITGQDQDNSSNFLIIELKQWESAEATDKEDIVKTFLNNGVRETIHPAYQAYSYKKYLSDMNSAVYEGDVRAISCAYLHNYQKKNPEPLLQEQYKEIVKDTPVFFSSDAEKLEDFVARYVGKGNGLGILYEIENGKIAPSKKFVDYVADVFEGNPVYTLLDEQKVAYSSIVDIALKTKTKTAIIVNGGPGTGKSVVAMNAFVTLLEKRLNVRFVAPNASFRECMVDTLGKQSSANKKRLKALFSGSGSYVNSYTDEFDTLICDEAHRLKKKGAFMYSGESQVEDIVKAARVSVFFVDDNQMIRPDDEGSVARIKEVCEKHNADVVEVKLVAQFRCSGAEGYLNWVDHTLQIQDTGNYDGWDEGTYDFKVFDDPNEMFIEVCKRNDAGFKARMLAGFAWTWSDAKSGNDNAQKEDVTIPECNFSMPWNSRKDQYTWATDEDKRNQIGCIHTSQGLEFDYVGVIIGNDLRFDENSHTIYASFDDYYDTAGKKGLKNQQARLTAYVKRIYKVLMSRGMKGCYVYCRDEKLREYLKERMNKD
ncbi:MAG: DUF2075 domain-containing protein [Clostridiales bacterium]|nr:DUF2075 domain-containing protein [Clostridiales bacterium]